MKNIFRKLNNLAIFVFIAIFHADVWADLPKPPDSDMANGNTGWLDVGGKMLNKAVSITSLALAAIILMGVAGGIFKAYHTAQEKGDLGHFFKMLVVGLLVAGLGLGLVYAGHQIVVGGKS